MVIFHSDLDNTLIYSYKHEIGDCKQCVEVYQGREISFMTDTSMELLKKVRERAVIVPTTTRTAEQYQRIHMEGIHFEYALVCNGGILLEQGRENKKWYEDSLKLVRECTEELEKAVIELERDCNRSFEVRLIRELFVFTKSRQPRETVNHLKKRLDVQKVDIFCQGVKIYVIPKKLNKGMAVRRFKKYRNAEYTIAAGDSVFDLPMASQADLFFAPGALRQEGKQHKRINYLESEEVFSDELLKKIYRIL